MSTLNSTLTAEQLRGFVDYDPTTGVFTWRPAKKGQRAKAGTVAGSIRSGYVSIMLFSRHYAAHRLAWLYVHGEWPTGCIDHADRNPANNAIANLRICTHAENHQNEGLRADNTSGMTGVSFNKFISKWAAYIDKNGLRHRLGNFDSFQDAANARIAAKARLHTFHPFQ